MNAGDYTPDNLPHRLLGRCTNLPSLGLTVEVLWAEDTAAEVWVLHVPRHAARKPVYAHDIGWQRDHDKLVPLRAESAVLLSPHPAEIVWKLPEERVVEPFRPPWLLATTAVMQRIRNPIIKLFPETQLVPVQVPRYDTQLVLEALHNCIAHQDYARCERIVVEERATRLRLVNAGGFVDGRPEDYFGGGRTPRL